MTNLKNFILNFSRCTNRDVAPLDLCTTTNCSDDFFSLLIIILLFFFTCTACWNRGKLSKDAEFSALCNDRLLHATSDDLEQFSIISSILLCVKSNLGLLGFAFNNYTV